MTTKNDNDYYRLASEFYVFEDLPDNYADLDDDYFHTLLEATARQPFEGYRGCDIAELIDILAMSFASVASNANKTQ